MRVVHLSSTDNVGGASRAAFRLHQALGQAGVDSMMLVRQKHSTDPKVEELCRPPAEAVDFYSSAAQTYYINRNRTPVSNSYFSLGWPGLDLSSHALIQSADVIHLHWVWDFQSASTLRALMQLGKPVVWTFHDQRAFTGGCHYSAGCRKYQKDCGVCPQLGTDPHKLPSANLADQALLWPIETVTVVASSTWMAECARRSSAWHRARIEVLPNSVDTSIYRARNQTECRRKLGIPEEAMCILFGADYLAEQRKGYRELLSALAHCAGEPLFDAKVREQRVCFVSLGHSDSSIQSSAIPIRSLGHPVDDDELANAYSAADVFLLPSQEDNLPSMALEAMSCGTPVLAFDGSGATDLVLEGRTGWLARLGDAKHLAKIILRLTTQGFPAEAMSRNCRLHVEQGFSPSVQSRLFLDLYRSLKKPEANRQIHLESMSRKGIECGPRFSRALPAILHSVFRGAPADLRFPAAQGSASWQLDRRRKYFRRVVPMLEAAAGGRMSFKELLCKLEEALKIPAAKPGWVDHPGLLCRKLAWSVSKTWQGKGVADAPSK